LAREEHSFTGPLPERAEDVRRHLLQAIATAMDGVAFLDDEGRYVFLNHAHLQVYGYDDASELLGKSWKALYIPDEVRRFEAEIFPTLRRDGRWRGEATGQRRDGSLFAQELSLTAIPEGGLVCVVRDVSNVKRAQKLESALYRLADKIRLSDDMESLFAAIHSVVADLVYAPNFHVALYDEATTTIRFPYSADEWVHITSTRVAGKGLTEIVLLTGEPLLATREEIADLVARGRIEPPIRPLADWLGVPLKRGEKTFGALVVQNYSETIRLTQDDKDILSLLCRDVASALEHKIALDALRESEERFRTLADTAPCAIFIYQGSSFRYANEATASISGYSRAELEGMDFWAMVHPDIREIVRRRGLARQKGDPQLSRYEIRIVRKDGEIRWLDYSAGLIELEGSPAVLGTAFDVTERKRAEERIRSLAYHDTLTGLPNRLLFADRLGLAVAQAHRLGQRLAVLFLDLDGFKLINDSLGHSLGDRLLEVVAERIQGALREGDTVARLGGDEFTLLLPGVSRAEDAPKVAEKILETLRQPVAIDGRELYVTGSVGISLYPDDGSDPETLVRNADAAMYRAKDRGRDNYQLYAPAMNATAVERLALESSLRKALSQDALRLHYQPLLDLATGGVYGVEALLRWERPGHGLVFPDEFIPLAELTGLIIPIGPWVWRSACVQVKRWHSSGYRDLRLAVNLSARQFQQPDVAAQVTRALEETDFPPTHLDLEITESYAMQNPEAAIQTLRELKAVGVGLSIDDFGVGYSSLSYLKRLPIDTLKIDRSFVRDITTDPDDAAIVTAVIAMARTLELRVVAEGVETEPQRAFLAAQGCDRAQGFLWSRAVPPDECEKLLR
jgi:diguanylate cyclase (GGDEF)-like protein/PAS domain S-box-containing protein